ARSGADSDRRRPHVRDLGCAASPRPPSVVRFVGPSSARGVVLGFRAHGMARTFPAPKPNDPVAVARRALLEGVGAEVAASFPGITRLGGQIVAALYLADS